jgi:hypothetical protein
MAAIEGRRHGWPVVIGGDDQLERIAELYSIDDSAVFAGGAAMARQPRTPSEILQAAAGIEFAQDLSRWPGAYRDEDLIAPQGSWPADPGPEAGLSVALDVLTGRPLENVHILLIPTAASWEVPAYLRWGDWNACPPAEYHVAALRRWHQRHGTELVGISADTMNIRATRRPSSRADALALAMEQYRYCPDIVDQGVETLSALGALLMAGDWWYFWWD